MILPFKLSLIAFCKIDQHLSRKMLISADLTDYSNEETIGSFGKNEKKKIFRNTFLS